MKSCSHPEMKDSSACSRCHFQQARLSSQRLCQRIPVSPRESTWARLLGSLFLARMATSSPSRPLASPKTVAVASNGTPCFLKVTMTFVNDTADAYEWHGSDCVLSLYQLYDRKRARAAAMRGTNKYF